MKVNKIWFVVGLALYTIAIYAILKKIIKSKEVLSTEEETVVCLPKSQFTNLIQVRKNLERLNGVQYPSVDSRVICFMIPTYNYLKFNELNYKYTKK